MFELIYGNDVFIEPAIVAYHLKGIGIGHNYQIRNLTCVHIYSNSVAMEINKTF